MSAGSRDHAEKSVSSQRCTQSGEAVKLVVIVVVRFFLFPTSHQIEYRAPSIESSTGCDLPRAMPHLLRRRTSDSTDAEVTLGLMPTSPPLSLAIPPPPPLDPDVPDSDPVSSSTYPDPDVDRTNTLALLLPHPSLFHPPVLALLRHHYEGYASIAHWAPIRGFGRVIVVFDSVEGAASAKKEGDRLWLDVDVTSPGGTGTRTGTGGIAATALALGEDPDGPVAQERRAGEVAGEVEASSRSYFSPRKRRKSASPAGG